MKIKNHYLHYADGRQVPFLRTPNQRGPIHPRYLVLHYTASTTSQGAVSWLTNPAARASAHLIIDRDGTLVQLARFSRRAWHAGISRWGRLENLNDYAIGIELVNAGQLKKNPAGRWVSWANQPIPHRQVSLLHHPHQDQPTGWHTYTRRQLAATLRVAQALHAHYRFDNLLGHEDIAPGRKIDPGPAFPLEVFRTKVLRGPS